VGDVRAFLGKLQATRGFLGFLLSVSLGALGVLGHAPFHFWPAFCVSICGLYLLMQGTAVSIKPMLAGFKVAWSWAFGYFLAGMFWVGNAFLVDAEKFAALMPIAIMALPAVLAVFWGMAGLVAARFWNIARNRLVLFALVFSLGEFARGHLLTGLPWNLPAYVWKPGEIISQSAALVGPYTLSTLTLLILASPIAIVLANDKRERIVLMVAGFAVTVLMGVFGISRLHQAGPVDPMKGTGPIIAAGQGEVWDIANADRVTQTYLNLLDTPDARRADIVIWPEGTFPFLLLERPDVLDIIQTKLGDRTLVLGAIRREQTSNGDKYSNSIIAMDVSNGGLKWRSNYDKFHLVPFGEYLPFRRIFSALGIASLVSYDGEMTPGAGPTTMMVKGAPLADPRVCYEVIFPSFNKAAIGTAGWIVNISIDAWYGDLLGPDQHYAQARMRAIETGRPVVRAASGGWSSITDRYGRALSQHHSGAGYAVARLPLDAASTLYDRFGEVIYAIFLAILLVIVMIRINTSVDFVTQVDDEVRE
jgi:apolipoprotein N-acyltransferase